VVEYRLRYFRFLVAVVLGGFSLAAAGLIFALVRGGSVQVAFVFLWLGMYGWNVYWFGFRVAYSVCLQGDRLAWHCLFSSGDTAYDRLRGVRPMVMASNVALVEIAGHRPVLLFAARGLAQFTAELRGAAPHISVRLGWQARVSERIGFRATGWRRYEGRGAQPL
jgi:hypothetical protein